MGPFEQFNHLLNFLAPALSVGTALALVVPFFYTKRPGAPGIAAQAAINSIASVGALALGLWYFGHDGKMMSYAAMLATASLSQALFLRH